MAKKPVTMSIREEDLSRLDEFALARRLSRGDAVGVLLDSYAAPLRVNHELNPRTIVDGEPEKYPAPDIDPKLLKLTLGKKVLEYAQEYTGVAPVSLEGEELVKGGPVPTALESFYKNKESSIVPEKRPVTWDDFNQEEG